MPESLSADVLLIITRQYGASSFSATGCILSGIGAIRLEHCEARISGSGTSLRLRSVRTILQVDATVNEFQSCYTHASPSRESSKQQSVSSVLEIIPLGGIGEFGMNCTLLRVGDEMVVLDAGMGFSEERGYGVGGWISGFDNFQPDQAK